MFFIFNLSSLRALTLGNLCLTNSFFNLFAEGCQAYGHVCYGGHGKRSLSTGSGSGTGVGMGETASGGQEQDYVRPNGLLPMMAPNEQVAVPPEADFNDYPARQVLYKIMRSWVSAFHFVHLIYQHLK